MSFYDIEAATACWDTFEKKHLTFPLFYPLPSTPDTPNLKD